MAMPAIDRKILPHYPHLARGWHILSMHRHVINLLTEALPELPVALVDTTIPPAPRQLRCISLPQPDMIAALLTGHHSLEPFDCTLRAPSTALCSITLDIAWRWLEKHASCAADDFSRTMQHYLQQSISQLLEALDAQQPPDAYVARLIGLGSGLTPSGDDFLCGLLLALYLPASPWHTQFSALRDAVLAQRRATHLLSAAFLYDAACGEASVPMLALIDALHHPPDKHSEARIAALTALGQRSGFDVLSGLLAGLPHSNHRRIHLCPYIAV